MAGVDFCWINVGQIDKWRKASRPEGPLWTGTAHRESCRRLGTRRRRLTIDKIESYGVQSCKQCAAMARR
jgi:hypothetical protein